MKKYFSIVLVALCGIAHAATETQTMSFTECVKGIKLTAIHLKTAPKIHIDNKMEKDVEFLSVEGSVKVRCDAKKTLMSITTISKKK